MDLGDARGERRLRIRYAACSRSSNVLRAAFLEGGGSLRRSPSEYRGSHFNHHTPGKTKNVHGFLDWEA